MDVKSVLEWRTAGFSKNLLSHEIISKSFEIYLVFNTKF
jgi:hypothetical protein